MRQHPSHRADPDSSADEHDRTTGIVEHHVTEGQRQGEHVTHANRIVQQIDIFPAGFPSPCTRLTENWRCSPSSARVRLYWRGWRTPSGIGISTLTYCPGSEVFTSRSSIRFTTKVTTSSVSRIFFSTCHRRHTVSGRTPRALYRPRSWLINVLAISQ